MTRFADVACDEPEDGYPPCWGKSYDGEDERCEICGKRLSCKSEHHRTYGGSSVAIRRTLATRASPAASAGPTRPSQATSDPHAGCAGTQPVSGEGHAERLGKNVLAAIIRAIAYEILEFFKRYQF